MCEMLFSLNVSKSSAASMSPKYNPGMMVFIEAHILRGEATAEGRTKRETDVTRLSQKRVITQHRTSLWLSPDLLITDVADKWSTLLCIAASSVVVRLYRCGVERCMYRCGVERCMEG